MQLTNCQARLLTAPSALILLAGVFAPIAILWLLHFGLLPTNSVVSAAPIGIEQPTHVYADSPSLFGDPDFLAAFRRSVSYTALAVALQIVFGVLSAWCMPIGRTRTRLGWRAWCVLCTAPYAIPSVVAVLAWNLLLKERGPYALAAQSMLDIDPSHWKGSLALSSLVIVSVWQFFPFVFLAVRSSMNQIPLEKRRIVEVEGIRWAARIRHFVLPATLPTIAAVTAIRLLFMWTKFDTAWLLFGSTANFDGETIPVYAGRQMTSLDIRTTAGLQAACVVSAVSMVAVAIVLGVSAALRRSNGGNIT